MLTIFQPEIHIEGDTARLEAVYDCDGVKNTLWFSTTVEYADYLCHEHADAFLVALLFNAMKEHHDIHIKSTISTRLYYTLTRYFIPVLCHMNPSFIVINITCDKLDSTPLPSAGGVGTGVSCGIDSLYTIAEHTREECPIDYRLTHLAFFNVGSHGTGAEGRKLYHERLHNVRKFAQECGLPIVTIDSNVGDIGNVPFVAIYTVNNISCVLSLQKLFRNYHCSSGYAAYDFKFKWGDASYYEPYSLSMLSTNDTSFIPTGSAHYRTEKTAVVAEYPLSYRFLNVCITSEVNCSICAKCMRTLLTLEVQGKIGLYSQIFDLQKYARQRNKYIGQILAFKSQDALLRDIYQIMMKKQFAIPPAAYLFGCYYAMKKITSQIKDKRGRVK